MGLFGFGKEEAPAAPSALEVARGEYRARRGELPGECVTLKNTVQENRFPAREYRFACDEQAFYFLPILDEAGEESADAYRAARVQRFPRAETAAALMPQRAEPTRREGAAAYYEPQPFTLLFTGEKLGEARFTLTNTESAGRFLREQLPECAPPALGGLFDKPEKTETVRGKKGGGVLPDNMVWYVWREEDELVFTRKGTPYYGREKSLIYARIPVSAVQYYRQQGEVQYETRVSGGEVTIDREGARWGGMFSFNTNADMLENAIQTTPVRTERVEHDNRTAELAVEWEGRPATLEFAFEALAVFEALVPGLSFEERATAGAREPTVAEQIEILANLCDRGRLTEAEYEEAKRRLLAKL